MMLSAGSRNERRVAYAAEQRARATGKWGAWRATELPNGGFGSGWLREVRVAYANDLYAVLVRPILTPEGLVTHCAIRTASNAEPPWRDKQRIKNELFGQDRVAIEVMPEADLVVDQADMYHMWVLPSGTTFSFGLKGEERRPLRAHPTTTSEQKDD